ncbi:Hypothetical protein A7982_02384 [Minicystis rosea]|nr:Hypothetical protein A7982_02384 [Minicystis rosea]
MARPRASIFLALAAVLYAAPALAADPPNGAAKPGEATPPAPPAPPAEEEGETETGTKRPGAPDERTGHVYFGVSGAAVGPAGSMGPATPSSQLSPAGFSPGGFFGVGVGRHATLQVFGDWTRYLKPGACSRDCGGTGYTVGLGVTYHLAQGIAFDPWGSFGVAYRRSSFDVENPTRPDDARVRQVFHGIDVARIAIGGDFYPTSRFGFGPYLEADLGTNFIWAKPLLGLPPDVKNGPRTYAFFSVGIRIAFDPMRKPAPSAVGGASTGAGVARAFGLPGF